MKKEYSADELLHMPKMICEQGELQERVVLNYSFPMRLRLFMEAIGNQELKFLFQIDQSAKNTLKLSLHYMVKENNVGIFRVDYNGTHKNPNEITEFVPEDFVSYAGKIIYSSHVHYFIEGEGLNWAKPIVDTDFEIKDVKVVPADIVKAISAFLKYAEVKTNVIINQTLL